MSETRVIAWLAVALCGCAVALCGTAAWFVLKAQSLFLLAQLELRESKRLRDEAAAVLQREERARHA